MKTVRLYSLCAMAFVSVVCVFSYISGLEDGENAHWLGIAGVLVGLAAYALAKYWDKKGKLPEGVTDRKNDRA